MSHFMRSVWLAGLLVLLFSSGGQANYVLTQKCRRVYDAIFDLKLTTARSLIQEELKANPSNYYPYYLAEYVDAVDLIAQPSEVKFEAFKLNHARRREIMDNKFEDSPYYLAFRAEMYFLLGLFKMRYGERISGFRHTFFSLKDTGNNLEKFPGFAESRKLKAFFNIGMANMPPFARWAIGFFGINIEPNTGIAMLSQNLAYYRQQDDVQLLTGTALVMIIGHKVNKEPGKAYDFITGLRHEVGSYKLIEFFEANLAFRSGNNERALEILSLFDVTDLELRFDHYDYMMGNVLLRKLQPDANVYFENFLANTGFRSYTKEVTYKIAEYYLTRGNEQKFAEYKAEARKTAGDDLIERDREAKYDCSLEFSPNAILLKADLQIAGGYLQGGEQYLAEFAASKSTFTPYKIEYNLLLGKLFYRAGDTTAATAALQRALKLGENEDYQYAAEAAVLLGKLYEGSSTEQAIIYYTKAQALYEDEYYEVIDSYAKSRLSILRAEE
jgi:hypothetical protein